MEGECQTSNVGTNNRMGIARFKNKRVQKVLETISVAIEQDRNIFRHLDNLKKAFGDSDEEDLLNEVRERYKIDQFVHQAIKGSHSLNRFIETSDYNPAVGKMTMAMLDGRVVTASMPNFTQFAKPITSIAKREDEVLIQVILMMDHAEEILFAQCASDYL